MYKAKLNISSELHVSRFNNGIKLIRPELSKKTQPTVGTILQMPFAVYFEGLEHIAASCNEICAEECGFISVKECLSVEWFKPFKPATVKNSIANDKDVVLSNSYKIIEEFAYRNDDVSLHTLSVRMPWYNSDSKIIGLFGCSLVLGKHQLDHSLSLIREYGLLSTPASNLMISRKINNQYLSKREIECLKLTIRGKSAKQVSIQLGISQRTVEEYLNNIKLKLGASSKSELIEMTIDYFYS